jgi:hypothetical protein
MLQQGRQRGGRGHCRGGDAHGGGAGAPTAWGGQLRHRVGRRTPAWPQRVGGRRRPAGARLLPPQVRQIPPKRGLDAVTVPGAVAGWVACRERFGALPFADLLRRPSNWPRRLRCGPGDRAAQVGTGRAPAAEPARLSPMPSCRWGARRRWASCFRFPAAARALRAIAESKGEAFYRGEIAQAIDPLRGASTAAHCAPATWRPTNPNGSIDHPPSLPGPHRARDAAQRPGHRRADRAGHARAL